MTKVEDVNLIQCILTGNTEAENILYERYCVILTNYLCDKFPNDSYIEDDVSEILIKVFLSLPNYDCEISKFKTWVFSIANNHMIDKSRSSYYINSTGTTQLVDGNLWLNNTYTTSDATMDIGDGMLTYTTSNNADINFEQNSSVNFVADQIQTCDFTFLNMHYSLGYSYCEIGDEFNLSSNTISNRVNYIKSKLKNCIDSEIVYE